MVDRHLAEQGYVVFPAEPSVGRWAEQAQRIGQEIISKDPELRHGGTWFVGVDALPNGSDGSLAGVPLRGAWLRHVSSPASWHRAQLSVIFPGYPRQDRTESVAAHRFRRDRDAAHVDGLLPVGPQRRRFLKEPHAFIAGIPLDDIAASPLVVWHGSHLIMGAAFRRALAGASPSARSEVDLTEVYHDARRTVLETCRRIELRGDLGQVLLLHRHLLHGVAPWTEKEDPTARMIAYFRPAISIDQWLG